MSKHSKNNKNVKKIIIAILEIVFIVSIISIVVMQYFNNKFAKKQQETSQILNTINISQEEIVDKTTERTLKIIELKKENQDIVGWLEIQGTNINYPILQGKDNNYYLTHNYKGEYVAGGSLFLDKDYDFSIPSSNLLIYGHRNKKGLMFEDLVKYKDEQFYKEHPTIRFTTTNEDVEYEIISVFNSKVYREKDTNVFKYYYFINAQSEKEYKEYIENCKRISIYETEKTAEYGEQLLTLSTCDYTVENGRFVVVAKKIK